MQEALLVECTCHLRPTISDHNVCVVAARAKNALLLLSEAPALLVALLLESLGKGKAVPVGRGARPAKKRTFAAVVVFVVVVRLEMTDSADVCVLDAMVFAEFVVIDGVRVEVMVYVSVVVVDVVVEPVEFEYGVVVVVKLAMTESTGACVKDVLDAIVFADFVVIDVVRVEVMV